MKKYNASKNKLFIYPYIRFLILIVVCFLTTVSGLSQSMADLRQEQSMQDIRISVDFDNTPIDEALIEIGQKAGLTFNYNASLFKQNIFTSFQGDNASIEAVLQAILPDEVGFRHINGSVILQQKNQRKIDFLVSGRVIDAAQEESLPGVNISVKGTNIGTSTDAEGQYSLSAPSVQDTLTFSFIGYQTEEIAIQGRSEIDVALQPEAIAGEEVVVVGYGRQEKENLTTSVDQIDGAELARRPNRDLAESLQGKLPGVNITKTSGNPGTTPDINIRGFTSINGGQPLVLIDGVEGDINDINPENVESVSVLKDAAASSIYGGRAAFGVVLVTTKSPEPGQLDISYDTNFSVLTPTANTDFVTDGLRAAELVDKAFRISTGNSYTGYTEQDYEELRQRSENPSLPSVVVQNRNGAEQFVHYASTDWWNTLFQSRRPTQTHNLSISGGSDRLRGYLSGRYYSADGIIKPQDDQYNSYNVRGKLEFKVAEWLQLSNNLQVNQNENIVFGGNQNGWASPFAYNLWNHMMPFYAPRNPDGSLTHRSMLNNYTMDGGGTSSSLLYGKSQRSVTNHKLLNTIEAEITPLANLSITANYTNRLNFSKITQRNTRVPWSINPDQVEYFGNDQLLEARGNDTYQAFNAYANYQQQFGRHQLKATVGLNQEHATYDNISASKQNSISVDLNALNLGSTNPQADGSAREWALSGYFYRLNYDYDGRYLAEFNGRYDGTSRFPNNNRWGFFPSASVGWVISNEPFFNGLQESISQLKLRASYGSLGNQQVGTYAYTPTLSKGTSNYLVNETQLEYVNPPGVTPNDITWEKVNTLNAGLDMSLFQDKITASVDVFQRRTIGMLTKGRTLPAVLGTGAPRENAANLRTRGFELQLGYQNTFQLADKPFNLAFTGALSNQKTVITKFDNPNNFLGDYYEGQTIGEIWGYHVGGLFQTDEEAANHADQTRVNGRIASSPGRFGSPLAGDVRYVDLNNDGVISEGDNTLENPGDQRVIGNAAPQFPYSFSFDANWNNVDLSLFFQGIGKQDWYPGRNSLSFWGLYARGYASFIRKDMAENIWSEENPDAYYPRLRAYVANNGTGELTTVNDRYMQDISYLRLKNITIGYTLPRPWLQKLNVRNIRIYASGENLLTFSSLTDYVDPEGASNGINLGNPISNYGNSNNHSRAMIYPFSKIYSLGINIDL